MTLLAQPPTLSESREALRYIEGNLMEGWPVYAIQAGLEARGFSIVVDGSFGLGTERKVKTFQENNGLLADGIVGPATKRRLVEKVAALVDEVRPSLPDRLIRELCRAEGGDNPSAINEFDPPTGPNGTDCGVVQLRCIEPYDMDDLREAFNPYAAMHEAADRYEAAVVKYRSSSFPWSRQQLTRAQRCALMAHNWPVGADNIASDGQLSNPNGEAAWVPDGVRMLDGTAVNTRQEWVDFYAMGFSPHCGPMPAEIRWGQ